MESRQNHHIRMSNNSTPIRSTNKHTNLHNHMKRVRMMNNSKLLVNKYNSLVICDWDDTLFPTSWVNDNSIDLTDMRSRYIYAEYFDVLDKNLSDTIRQIKKCANLMIVTNATLQWIYNTLTVLPKTKKLLEDVPIVSARDAFQKQYNMQDWKEHTFKAELSKAGRSHYKNIISIGDAHYEHKALVSLYNWDVIPHKYLKSVKFIRSIDFKDLIKQINVISEKIFNIVKEQRHMDQTFEIV